MTAEHDFEDRKPMIERLYEAFANKEIRCKRCGKILYSITDSWNHTAICKKRVQSK